MAKKNREKKSEYYGGMDVGPDFNIFKILGLTLIVSFIVTIIIIFVLPALQVK
ncbi:MAG: hypothetical protein N3B21_03870 [Clostridia bacterium]|nr:hypothetical protein [Clostridia bacterium]